MSRWFPFFNNKKQDPSKVLLNYINKDKFIVCKEDLPLNGSKPTKYFASFKDYNDFVLKENYTTNENKSLLPKPQSYYEIINSDIHPYVKMYFDIDCNTTISKDILDKELLILKSFLSQLYKVKFNTDVDVLLFSSSFGDKKSYHIVIDKACMRYNTNLFKKICLYVKKKMSELNLNIGNFIDEVVYKSTQQFRLFGSMKYGTNRVKREFIASEASREREASRESEAREASEKSPSSLLSLPFPSSLLSFTDDCKKIEFKNISLSLETEKKRKSIQTESCFLEDIPESDFLETFIEEGEYDVKDVIKTEIADNEFIYLIILKRNQETYCEVCEREHPHENPYIVVFNSAIRFFCRRSEGNRSTLLKRIENRDGDKMKMKNIDVINQIDLEKYFEEREIRREKDKISFLF